MIQRVVAGRYELEDVISDFEHTAAYRAVDLHLRRNVTVRILDEDRPNNPARTQRFLDEARAAAAYAHPNVVATYDAGVDDGLPFSVSEYVEGEQLDALIREAAPLRADRLRSLGTQLTSALDYAQKHDGTEYSISPSDVVVTRGDRIKVQAFQRRTPELERKSATEDGGVTGIALRTFDDVEERPVGVQAVGVLLYEMATGRRPFRRGQVPQDSLSVDQVVRPASLNPYLSPALERTILGAMTDGPGRRYRSLSELAIALEAQDETARPRQYPEDRTTAMPVQEVPAYRSAYRESPTWPAVIIPTLVLALVLVAAVYAAIVVRPQIQLPTVAAIITGSDQSASRDSVTATNQAADLEKAITTVRSNTDKLNGAMGLVRDRLTAEMAIVDGMRGQLDDMKREASTGGANPGKLALLAAKRQSFEFSYSTLGSARKAFADAATNVESNLAPMEADAGRARDAAGRLQSTLSALPAPVSVDPRPGDEVGPIAGYTSAAQAARNDLASMRKSEQDLANAATSLRQQADDAAAMRVSSQPAPSATPMPGSTPLPTGVAGPNPTPGSTTTAPSPTPGTASSPNPTPATVVAPRPTAPPPPRSAVTYPVGNMFLSLTNQLAGVVGTALEKEHPNASGDMFQRTTGGLLVWSKAANRAYFTDGFVTWVIGPNGLQSRPNDQQFDWEKSPPTGQH